MKSTSFALAALAVASSATISSAGTLSALSSFGNGDGWRAAGEVVVGDTAGTDSATPGTYNYLLTGSLERGMAYNPVSGNLILVSRSAVGNGLRVLSGTTGADVGFLNQGTGIITGGTFFTSVTGVGSDGQIYVSNLQANVTTGAYKVYQWTNEAAVATTYFNSTIAGFTGTPRLGDDIDVTGSGASTGIVAGASGVIGYASLVGTTATAVTTFAPVGPTAGDFRLGITYAGSSTDVWGKQTGNLNLRRTTTAGVFSGNSVFNTGDAAMDYAVIGGVPCLALLNMNTGGTADSTTIRVFYMPDPANPVLMAFGENTTGTLATNGNGTGAVKWGAINQLNSTATVYAMSTNHGIQAFSFSVPEPASLAALGAMGSVLARRRR